MGINLLPSEIYNKISAGEVVERPSSVVKELVENSIDGGANKISVEVFGGGIEQIIVSDNGKGIEPDEIEKAFLPHATSKISSEKDLFNISSLGFRGEALASIASVSKVEILSKTENNEFGVSYKIEGGVGKEKREVGFENGTRICVSNLFFNTPARLKFLKKPKSEEGEITSLIAKIILANPSISIRYSVDNKIIYNTFGNGLSEAMYIVYGKETYDNLLEINYERDGISVFGYLARPTFCKPNRTYQTVFVNGRVVSNYMISSAVQDAVEPFIMKGKFPLFALNIILPYDMVDVNVHPSKQEVKFENPNKIYGIVSSAIYKVVSNASYVQQQKIEEKTNFAVEEKLNGETENEKQKNFALLGLLRENCSTKNPNFATLSQTNSTLSKILSDKFIQKYNFNEKKTNLNDIQLEEVEIKSNKTENIVKNEEKIEQKSMQNLFVGCKIIGVLFGTYILAEKDDFFYIIDQHAGHERQLFDKFQKQIEKNELTTQVLLVPYVFSTNIKETQFLEENLDALLAQGFDISPFGQNTFKVSSVPLILEKINLKEFFENILQNTSSMKISAEAFKNKVARMACRTAVKANDKLSNEEIEVLLNDFVKNNNVLLCPHGRPIVVAYKKSEIEKMFKRIV